MTDAAQCLERTDVVGGTVYSVSHSAIATSSLAIAPAAVVDWGGPSREVVAGLATTAYLLRNECTVLDPEKTVEIEKRPAPTSTVKSRAGVTWSAKIRS